MKTVPKGDFCPLRSSGFTLVELVVIIVIVGVLALVAGPRFVGRDTFDSRGFYDKATATVRFAQKTAVAWRRPVFVCVTATRVAVGAAAGCSPAMAAEDAPSGVTLNVVTFNFDALGRALPGGAAITFTSTIADDPARQISIAAETGYVAAN